MRVRALCATEELKLFSLISQVTKGGHSLSSIILVFFSWQSLCSLHHEHLASRTAKTPVLLSPHRQTTYFGRPHGKTFFFPLSLFKCFQNPLGKKLFPTFYCLMRLESSRNMLSAVTSEQTLCSRSTYTML